MDDAQVTPSRESLQNLNDNTDSFDVTQLCTKSCGTLSHQVQICFSVYVCYIWTSCLKLFVKL